MSLGFVRGAVIACFLMIGFLGLLSGFTYGRSGETIFGILMLLGAVVTYGTKAGARPTRSRFDPPERTLEIDDWYPFVRATWARAIVLFCFAVGGYHIAQFRAHITGFMAASSFGWMALLFTLALVIAYVVLTALYLFLADFFDMALRRLLSGKNGFSTRHPLDFLLPLAVPASAVLLTDKGLDWSPLFVGTIAITGLSIWATARAFSRGFRTAQRCSSCGAFDFRKVGEGEETHPQLRRDRDDDYPNVTYYTDYECEACGARFRRTR